MKSNLTSHQTRGPPLSSTWYAASTPTGTLCTAMTKAGSDGRLVHRHAGAAVGRRLRRPGPMTPAGRWLTWAALTGASFTALEADALRRRDLPSTLTHCLRAALGLQPRRPRYLLRVTAFNLALLWTACHITSGRLGFDVRWRGADPCEYLED